MHTYTLLQENHLLQDPVVRHQPKKLLRLLAVCVVPSRFPVGLSIDRRRILQLLT